MSDINDEGEELSLTSLTKLPPGEFDITASSFHILERENRAYLQKFSLDVMVEALRQYEKRNDFYLNRIVCAANYFPGFGMLIAPRHWDSTMHQAYERAHAAHEAKRATNPDIEAYPEGHKFAQGFIDKHGKWLTREEAWVIAEAAGQIIRRVGGDTSNGGRLFSENLY